MNPLQKMRLPSAMLLVAFYAMLTTAPAFALDGVPAVAGMRYGSPANRDLVEIEYEEGKETNTLWISQNSNGSTRDIPDWAVQGGSSGDPNAPAQAAECLKLLKSAPQPNDVPADTAKIVIVRCEDGDKFVVKMFPIDKVPQEVWKMLNIMGYKCDKQSFGPLKFIQIPATTAEEQKKSDLEDVEIDADMAHRSQKYDDEIECWTRALKIAPDSPVYHLKRAGAYAAHGTPDQVAADCAEVIRLDPKNEEPYQLRAVTYRKNGIKDKAIEAFSEWINFNPKAVQAYEERAFLYWGKDDDKLIADYSQAIALYEEGVGKPHTTPYTMRAGAYERKGEKEKAIADYTEAIKIAPNWPDAYSGRAGLYFDEGEFDKAFADYDRAVDIRPKDLNVFMDRGYAYYHRGNWEKALADVETVLQLKPEWINALVLRGNIYAAQGDYAKALKEFDDAISQNDRVVTGYNAAAWLMATCPDEKFRDGAKAVEYAEKSCEIAHWHWDGDIDTLAAAYAESGKWEEAVNYENLAIKVAGKNEKAVKDYTAHLALFEAHKPYRTGN